MGKKQHQSDKLYITSKEWKEEWGGKKEDLEQRKFRRLPYNYCSLSLQPFSHPLCTKEGVIFDILSVVPYLKKYGKSPVTGEPMQLKDLIKLHFHKNNDDKYHCPITFKIFTENSHIVAIKQSGNVYSYDAVQRLNIKPKNYKDLLTDQTFTRKDIITIQDPLQLDKFNITKFYHVRHGIKVVTEDEIKAKNDPRYTIRKASNAIQSTLNELDATYKKPEWMKDDEASDEEPTEGLDAAHFSTGAMAGSFTSTAQMPKTKQKAAVIDKDVRRYEKVEKKGYVRLETNLGDLNMELHCDMVPRTCENFITHAANGYYDNTVFHRSIKNFMIQGGDPTATGKGGESIWGKPFKDEIKPNLVHQGRGIISMANSGQHTNGSQFFITFRSCRHLDTKHSVFGHIVGGLETLSAMETVKTDSSDKPLEEIKIIKAHVFVNPYEEADKVIEDERENEEIKKKELEKAKKPKKKIVEEPRKVFRSGVGKYIAKGSSKKGDDDKDDDVPKKKKKSNTTGGGFSDFSSW